MANPAKVFDNMEAAMKAAKGRRPRGALREKILDYLRENATTIAEGLDAREIARGIGEKDAQGVSLALSKMYAQGKVMRARSHVGRGYRYWYIPPQMSKRGNVRSELNVLLRKTEQLLAHWREFGGALLHELERAEEMRNRLLKLESILKGNNIEVK